MWHAAKWRETAHRVRELAKRLHEDDESLQVLLTLADDCDAQAEDLERAGKKTPVKVVNLLHAPSRRA